MTIAMEESVYSRSGAIGCLGSILALAALVVWIGFFVRGREDPSILVSVATAEAEATATRLQQDLDCLREQSCAEGLIRWRLDARSKCKAAISKHARYSIRWGDGFLLRLFDDVYIQPPEYETVRYVGHRVSFENAYGAWAPMRYSCDYDPISRVVVRTDVAEGR